MTSGARPTKRRRRRTRAEIERIKDAIYGVAQRDHPVTIRQAFYRLVSAGLIEKTESEYSSTVVRLCAAMRQSGELPWVWIADNTRWMRRPDTFDSVEDALAATAHAYRRALWTDADAYLEVWLEKEALAGVLSDVTYRWDVPLMVTRGYASLTFLQSAASCFPTDRMTHVYYFGDHDPSGVDIARNTREKLHRFAGPEADLNFARVAVTDAQIEAFDLPTRPTKRTDSRARSWTGGSVEVDAIPPDELRALCEDRILEHVDRDVVEHLELVEREERDALIRLAARGLS